MKTLIMTMIYIVISVSAFSQSKKFFLNKDGLVADSSKAKSYLVVLKADSLMAVKQYAMNKEILMRGTYKGEDLKIPHGMFYYYFDSSLDPKIKQPHQLTHPANKVEITGEFNNGQKTGLWEEYHDNGNKKSSSTYKNGIRDGKYQSYNYENGKIYLSGNYVNNLEDGEWDIYSLKGNVMKKDYYEKGKIINSVRVPLPFDPPTPKYNFSEYIGERIISLVPLKARVNTVVTCKVSKSGKLFYSSLIDYEDPSTDKLKNKVTALIESAKPWTPAYDPKLKDNIEYELTISIRGKNGDLYVSCSEDGSGLSYQFTH